MSIRMFKVPDVLIDALAKLACKDPSKFLRVHALLAKLVLRPQESESQIKDAVGDFWGEFQELADIDVFLDFLIGAHSFRAYAGLTAERATEEMIDLAGLVGNEGLEKNARILLKMFLELNNISVAFKAASLMLEFDYLYIRARSILDIRPVFGDPCGNGVVGGVVCHSVRLSLQKDGELMDFSFSLDTDGLLDIKSVIDRAIEKDSIARANYNNIVN